MTDGGWAEMIAGLNSLTVALEVSGARAGAKAAVVIAKTSHDIETDGKIFCPVDTGNLRSTIGTTITGDGRSGSIESDTGPTADYGMYVEAGTSRQAPQAYMGPAFDRHAAEFEAACAQIVAETLL